VSGGGKQRYGQALRRTFHAQILFLNGDKTSPIL
jgi:hypothetical protein